MISGRPGWWFNEFHHPGVDFDETEVVETYANKQGTRAEDEHALLNRLGISAQHTVIEFGCGTGLFAIEASKRCQHVYAVDVSNAMLNAVRRSAESAGIMNLTTVNGGFLSYEHPAASADYIVTKYALHHLPDFWKGIALIRLENMLQPGGILYLEDVIFSFDPDASEQAVPRWIKQVVRPDQPSFSVEEFEMHVREEYSTFDWIIEGLLERAGFDIREKQLKSDTYANYVAVKRR